VPVFGLAVAGLLTSAYVATERAEALSLFTSSHSYHIRGKLKDGIRQLRRALDRAPESLDVEDAYRRLCVMTMAQGVDVMPVIDEGLEYSPRSATLIAYRVAAASVVRDEPWRSIDEMSAAQVPALAQAFHHMGKGFLRQGDLTGASAALRTALHLEPDRRHTRAQLATTLSNLAAALVNQGRQEDARAAYEEAILLEPGRPEFHANLGALVLMAGDEREAVRAFDRSVNAGSTDPDVYWTLARLYLHQGARSAAART
jgi:tetratricopeptide (TPR) repeat protein